jgi:DNA invertase Pin-like site-specific DNA recombinase
LISRRTKEALAAAKAKGVKLGNAKLAKANKTEAAARDTELRPILVEFAGKSYRAVAAELGARKIPAPHGGGWNHMSAARSMKRLGLA